MDEQDLKTKFKKALKDYMMSEEYNLPNPEKILQDMQDVLIDIIREVPREDTFAYEWKLQEIFELKAFLINQDN